MRKVILNVRNSINANYLFMAVVSIILGLFAFIGTNDESALFLSSSELMLKGYFFMLIMFGVELSKEMLQKEKITRRTEWLLANKISLRSICVLYSVSLFLSTSLLLLPLIIITFFIGNGYTAFMLIDFYAISFIYGIIINIAILYIKNMNKFKSLTLSISALYVVTTIGETLILLVVGDIYLGLLFKYGFNVLVAFSLWKLSSKERAVSAYF